MLSRRYRSVLAGTTSALTLAAALPAFAAEQQAQAVVGIEEITVTARRVEENIQRVPIAITAFTPEKLLQQDIKDVWTLTKEVGGLNICCSAGNTSFIFVRGIGNGAPTYFADVPAPSDGFGNFFDIQNVQVLKGPQGTLFGQASNAGAFVYTPRKPGNVLSGSLTVSGGNYGRREIQGGLDIPLVEDRVLFRMAAQTFYRNGYIIDITNQKDYANQNYYILRPSLTLKITDDIESYTIFQYYKQKSNGPSNLFVLSDLNMRAIDQALATGGPGGTAFFAAGAAPLTGLGACLGAGNLACVQYFANGGTFASDATYRALRDQVLATQLALGPYKINGLSTSCAFAGGDPNGANGPGQGSILAGGGVTNLTYPRVACLFNWERRYFIANTTTWNFADDWSVKNIIGLRRSKTYAAPGDTDGTPLLIFDGGSPKNNTPVTQPPTWSDEVQVTGKLFDIADVTFGTFHTATYSYPKATYTYNFGGHAASTSKTSSYSRALYGQANIDLSEFLEGLTFTGGYRKTWDKTASQSWALNATTLATTKVIGGPTSLAGLAKFSSGSYTIGFQYQYSPNTMFFVTNSKGFSSGGLQNVVGFERFTPDALNNLEGGIKSTFELGGMQTRVNASYFYGWYSNVKVSVTTTATNPATGVTNLVVVTQNAASAHVQGLDADMTILPTDYLELGGFVAYTRNKYTRFPSVRQIGNNPPTFVPVDLSGTPFSFTARVKYSLRGTYHFPLDQAKWGDMSLSANFTHTGTLYNVAKPFTAINPANPDVSGLVCYHTRTTANGYGPLTADGKRVPVDCNPPYHNLDLNVDWKDILGNQGLSATFAVTNVTKNTQNDGGCYCNNSLGNTSPIPQVPRMFSIKLQYNF